MYLHLVDIYQVYQMPSGSKMAPPLGHMFNTGLCRQNIKKYLCTQTAMHRIFILGTCL